MTGDQDFEAALSEIRGNVDVRRLIFIFMHVLLPAAVLAAADACSGAAYPPELAWLPRHALGITGALVCACGVVASVVLMRCHFGLVVNAMKMQAVLRGSTDLRGLNWGGVTTNFVTLCALSAAGGALLLVASVGSVVAGGIVAAALVLAGIWLLVVNHGRANALARRLEAHWEHAPVSPELIERHGVMSLEDCNADVAIIVTMAAALFAGFFGAMTNIGGIPDGLALDVPVEDVKRLGVPVCAGYLAVSLLLSARMVLRLRVALAGHSARLARLRGEPDDPWRFRLLERTFLLYLLVLLLLVAAAVMLAWSVAAPQAAAVTGPVVGAAGIGAYGLRLVRARRSAQRGGGEAAA